ncbi:DUF4336 domain-containing protein [Synechococcus sp. CS-1325]|uniref:DUF4336 domain-containing protein n=1 Tax=unclassified Synechococcus TaxID=2626047 RepID=UPI000DB30F9E|nr:MULTISPECIES: DUF4336 domain-containing protein [unclassified Synechococcus]MCT0198367.1 DUF4336 domain-containing protein [Synechococcus sp. CS-1325]MCT0212112.1 DUF4336 domain-containing protein [Synechococcus sp. CS-1326]MCT0232900.1 DUF4336 domain-containing protein [Synechococcus sp. CS-1327]PZV00111.1 MAG: hypothetical protein DCF24_08120 [Cyanobium sp.]
MTGRPDRRWPWWPLLPLYPYGQRRTLVRELIPDQVWSFEQLQGVLYVAVPIRMTVLRLRHGLLLYAPVAPTGELLGELQKLVERFGPVLSIVLPTSSGLEHKLPVPAMARAFPDALLWVSPRQWSFPLPLPLAWLGFPPGRTRVLIEQGLPHADELAWLPLGPLDLGLGTFLELACFHRASGALLITDALVAISAEPPPLFEADPTPLLFHARERGDQPLVDGAEQRRRGWRRLVLFASYLRPASVSLAPWREVLSQSWQPGLRQPRCYFGFYPFRWEPGWEQECAQLLQPGQALPQVAPVLERLVFPRARGQLVAWLRELGRIDGLAWLVPAHYDAPLPCRGGDLLALAADLESRDWASSSGSWSFLAGLDQGLVKLGVVPRSHPPEESI